MIESGSHVPGIDAQSFGLPAGTALRYERPAAPLAPYVASYAALDSDPAIWKGPNSWLLPGWAQLWIVLTDAPIAVQVRNRHYASLGAAALYGPTSRAMPVQSHGGVSIVIDLTPLGWTRWFDVGAEAYRDRITPLAQFWPELWIAELIECLHASDRGPAVKALLDDFLLSRLPVARQHEDRIARATTILADPDMTDIGAAAAALDISGQTLLRLARRAFGYGPKFLTRRTRFLQALTTTLMAPDGSAIPAAPEGYHDAPHFLRDGKDFLGMTPRRFVEMPMPYLRAALRARRTIIGAPWPPLDPVRRGASACKESS